MEEIFEGDVSLVPYLSDSLFQLLVDLVEISKGYPSSIAYPAGCVIISVACIESYINELIYMQSFSSDTKENHKIKKTFDKFGTDILKKLKELKRLAKKPSELDNDLLDKVRMLIALRGKIAHYTVQEEYVNDEQRLSKLEKLERQIFGNNVLQGDTRIERLLSPITANISKEIAVELVKCLYKSGYEPPRPRWVKFIDPSRFQS